MSRTLSRAPAHTLELLVPYQRVALRVITQAFRDLERPGEAAAARAFLAGSPMLHHWCALAELDASSISATAQIVAARYEAPRSAGRLANQAVPRRATPARPAAARQRRDSPATS